MSQKWDIYFCGSIRAGRQDAELYRTIIGKLKSYGTVLTEFVGTITDADAMTANGDSHELSDKEIYEKDMRLLDQSEAVIAEVTQPSLGVGFEISRAVTLNKPLLCLYRPLPGKILSSLVRGIHNGDTFNVIDYKENDLDTILIDFFEKVRVIREKSKSADSTEITSS
ncbi:5-hydroxymethyl-dUMP N-hydrolase-like [Centruroides vittatus]|uniref:2'-deoxynucleoside 5'-phosphate N-hydrolase 1-like n=1 Tax=Centruroides sculpturatus TaxID=218467 RepID=UPI000C6DFB04|nr:2'-deoxynucleoside 5'-phosphate N-hydrolase 1-like [Centruroides sculpturatus]